MIGRTLGHYRIDARLGAGGMGVVYRAFDERLGRAVALKVLAEGATAEEQDRALLREARAASALNHPNICTVHEVGESEGRAYIVMELVEGTPLAELVGAPGLPLETALRYAVQTAQGLAHAHDRGVVHRDLKTANLLVTPDGRIKILDFGIAYRVAPTVDLVTHSRATLAELGGPAGTLPYIAPEILRGRPGDERSDIWGFGVVLHEMLTGDRPFTGQTGFELSAAIMREPPAPLPDAIPPALRAVVARCLAKEPPLRYRRASELLAVLEAIAADEAERARGFRRPARDAARQGRSVAVLPFRDLAGDPANAHLGLGLADATITELASVKSLVVRPTAAILRYQQGEGDPAAACRDLSVEAIVTGTFQRAGSRLRVTVQLVDAADGRSLWATRLNTSLEDVFAMQDEVAHQVAEALRVELTDSDRHRLAQVARAGSSAYEAYLKGRVHLCDEKFESVNLAIDAFETAIELEPGFAEAHAGLAGAYIRMAFTFDPGGDWYTRARNACEQALEANPQLPEGRLIRGLLMWSPAGRFHHAGALRELLAAAAARPSLNEAHHWLGVVLFHVSMLDEAVDRFQRALAINPDDQIAFVHFGFCRYLQGDFRTALEMSEEAARRAASHWTAYQVALAQIQLGLVDKAERTIETSARYFPNDVLRYPLRGLLAARRGQASRAEEQIALTVRHRQAFGHYHHAQYDVACVYALLGRTGEAVQWLREAAYGGFPCYAFFERDPLLATIQDHADFRTLMTELREECAVYRTIYASARESTA